MFLGKDSTLDQDCPSIWKSPEGTSGKNIGDVVQWKMQMCDQGDVGSNANIFETLSNKSGRFYFSHSGTRRLFLVRLAAISKNENFEFFHNVTL